MDLSNKVIMISGGSRGIGAAIAEGAACKGAVIIITGRDLDGLRSVSERIFSLTKIRPMVFQLNVQEENEIKKVVSEVLKEHKRIDVLINNAGIIRRSNLFDMSLTEWNEVLQTNLTGTFLVSKYVAESMKNNMNGSIINISSNLGSVAVGNIAHYVSSKGGVNMLTKALAVELAEYNIRVNAIAPGVVLTDMTMERSKEESVMSFWLSRIPLKRIGEPKDIVGAALFLASDASSYVTGSIIPVDGGWVAS